MPLPTHLALIPDGNRRWAKRRGRGALYGHRAGAKSAQNMFRACLKLNIPYVTFWGCSINNLTKRDRIEVVFLLALFHRYFQKLGKVKEIDEHRVRLRFLGRWRDYFPAKSIRLLEGLMDKTKDYDKHHLTFLLAYNGTEEMVSTVQGIVADTVGAKGLSPLPQTITESTIKQRLYTRDLPPVDLVIRTGGDPHLSTGFMMWDTSEAQLYFTDKMWPEFAPEDLQVALRTYAERERRHGK